MRPLELTRSGILATLGVFLVVVVCVRLGLWQLDRRAGRLARNAVVAERLAAPPVELDGVPVDTTGLTYRRASIQGVVDEEGTLVLAGRSHGGRPGVHLYSPVRIGAAALLVNRGWLPAPDAASVDLAPFRVVEPVRYAGVLLPFPESSGDAGGDGGFRRTWFRLDGDAIRAQAPYPIPPIYLLATEGPETASAYPLRLAPPALDAGPHLSYAIQWFSFAGVFLVGWAALVLSGRGRERGGGGTTGGAPPYQR